MKENRAESKRQGASLSYGNLCKRNLVVIMIVSLPVLCWTTGCQESSVTHLHAG